MKGRILQRRQKKVGVIAVDPSSPFSGGAVLGDRVRMGAHSTDSNVFIRSLGSRGCIGGISEGTKRVLYLFKTFDFDVIIVESLGVGQDETEITNFVDVTLVALVPGFGDSIQMAKAGIQEIGDIFIVNKSDHPDAELFTNQLRFSFGDIPLGERPPIINTVASDGKGLDELMDAIASVVPKEYARREEKARRRINIEIESEILEKMMDITKGIVSKKAELVFYTKNKITPYDVAADIIEGISFHEE